MPQIMRSILSWTPNLLTCSRFVIAPLIVLAALNEAWAWGFWLVIIALVTDFLDGLVAKAFNAYSLLGEKLDPVADFSFAAAGIASIILTGYLPLWVGVLMLLPALYVGYVNFFLAKDDKIRIMHSLFSIPYLFSAWIASAWFFAAQAYGWSWWYVAAAFVILTAAAIPKRHRLRAWFGWVFERAGIPPKTHR